MSDLFFDTGPTFEPVDEAAWMGVPAFEPEPSDKAPDDFTASVGSNSSTYIPVRIDAGRDGHYEGTGRLYSDGTLVSDDGWSSDTWEWGVGAWQPNDTMITFDDASNTGGGACIEGVMSEEERLAAEAAAFARGHVNADGLDMNDPKHRAWYQQQQNALEFLYIQAKTNPTAIMNGPLTHDFTYAQVLSALERVNIVLQTSYIFGGAQAQEHANGWTITIDVDSPEVLDSIRVFGEEVGRGYVIFHELGHTMGLYTEAEANTEGYALAQAVGMAYPTWGQLQTNTSTNGVVSQN